MATIEKGIKNLFGTWDRLFKGICLADLSASKLH